MSSLYRKYRPNQFSDLLGQDHIRSSIEGLLASDQVGHAYLFSGPRGTGKTTMARLLARALNCVGQKTGIEACGKCEICVEISDGRSVDIIEIDAASNRGIDEIRDLREKIVFAPTRSKYKVYIIDEVHMLTKEAFNALLKTLEEPPSHAIFILATTELHKVPETIISRCLRYQFHRASTEGIVAVLRNVAKKEGLKLDDDAAAVIAERAEGSFRDALSLLGSLGVEKDLSADQIRTLIGLPSHEIITQLLGAINGGQPETVAKLLREASDTGTDLTVLVRAAANECRRQIFGSSGADVATSGPILEELLVSLARSRHSVDASSLLAASLISASLKRANSAPKIAAPVVEQVDTPPPTAVTDLSKKEVSSPLPAVDSVSDHPIKSVDSGAFWPNFLAAVHEKNHALYAVVSSAQFEAVTEDKLIIAVKFRFYSERLFEPKNRALIESLAASVAGRPLVLECLVKTNLDAGANKEEDLLSTVVEVFEINE